jgi:hypothetical protein
MRHFLTGLFFMLVLPFSGSSQCVDSSRIDIYFKCYDGFVPVCGCDGKNYRNECAAYHWGGVNQYQSGICDNFEIDFVPNPVLQYPGAYSIFVKNPSPVLVQVYDAFGRIKYSMNYTTSYVNQTIGPVNISFDSYEVGIYYFVVTVRGEIKTRNVMRVVE